MKTRLTFLIVALLMTFFNNQYGYAQKELKCGGAESAAIGKRMPGQTVMGKNRAEARESFKQILLAVTDGYICQKCPVPPPDRCEMFVSYLGSSPNGSQTTDSTYTFKPGKWTWKVKCKPCPVPKKATTAIADPVDGTPAMCDGTPNDVMLDMPGVVIFDIDGEPFTEYEAQQRWITMIIHDNGNRINGSGPWGCMLSECELMGMLGCNMMIMEDMSEPLPMPFLDEETGGWAFEPMEYMMIYFCSPCEPGEVPVEDPVNPDLEGGTGDLIENVYPSPAETNITLVLNLSRGNTEISIFDMSSKLVKTYDISSSDDRKVLIDIDVSDLVPGVYQLQVVNGGNVSTKNFLVQ